MPRGLRTERIQNSRFVFRHNPIPYSLTNIAQHNDHFGDEKMMEVLFKMGRMGEKKNQIASLSDAEMSKVAQAAARGGSPPPAVRSGEPNRKL